MPVATMPLNVICPHCTATLNVPDKFIGRRVKCSKCGGVVNVTAPVEPVYDEPRPSNRPRRRDDEDDRRPRKKQKNYMGLILGLLLGFGLLTFCCVAGVGVGIYYYVDANDNSKVTEQDFNRLRIDMTLAEVKSVIGSSGKEATVGDVNDAFGTSLDGGLGGEAARVPDGFRRAAAEGRVYCWRKDNIVVLILFNGPPRGTGRTIYHSFSQRSIDHTGVVRGGRWLGRGTIP